MNKLEARHINSQQCDLLQQLKETTCSCLHVQNIKVVMQQFV